MKLENEQQFMIAKKIQEMTGAKNIKLKPEVDPALLGGFVVTYGKDGSGYIDMSVAGQVAQLIAMRLSLSKNDDASVPRRECGARPAGACHAARKGGDPPNGYGATSARAGGGWFTVASANQCDIQTGARARDGDGDGGASFLLLNFCSDEDYF